VATPGASSRAAECCTRAVVPEAPCIGGSAGYNTTAARPPLDRSRDAAPCSPTSGAQDRTGAGANHLYMDEHTPDRNGV
jgi:hypothetical protein